MFRPLSTCLICPPFLPEVDDPLDSRTSPFEEGEDDAGGSGYLNGGGSNQDPDNSG